MDGRLWWFIANWAVPILGPPLFILGIRGLSALPTLGGAKGAGSAVRWPKLDESLDVAGWLFLTVALVGGAFGDVATAQDSVPLRKVALGVVFLVAVLLLYVFTLQAQGTAQASGGKWAAPAIFRVLAFVVTLFGAVVANYVRGTVLEAGGDHAADGQPRDTTGQHGAADAGSFR
jgi:hypothetical protein